MPKNPKLGVYTILPVTGSTEAVPLDGPVKTVTPAGTKEVPGLPGRSLSRDLIITAVLINVFTISALATGGLLLTAGSNTVITSLAGVHKAFAPG